MEDLINEIYVTGKQFKAASSFLWPLHVFSMKWNEEKDHPFCRRWRCWKQGRADQQAYLKDELRKQKGLEWGGWHREAGRSREECVRARSCLPHRSFVGIHEKHMTALSVAGFPARYLPWLVLLCLTCVSRETWYCFEIFTSRIFLMKRSSLGRDHLFTHAFMESAWDAKKGGPVLPGRQQL